MFEGASVEERLVNLHPDVPVLSKEMMRRHQAAGRVPCRPWCKHWVACAANLPKHPPRCLPIGNTPEIHGDYCFFRDKKGDKENIATALVLKDRHKKMCSANVVPKKGVGDSLS